MWILFVLGCQVLYPCSSRDEAACEGSCEPIRGSECGVTDSDVYVGCVDREASCDPIELGCRPDDGSSGCVIVSCLWDFDGESCPAGWSTCADDGMCPPS